MRLAFSSHLYYSRGRPMMFRRQTRELTMTWTDERVARLKKLWADGCSALQIASDLGGVTRHAVIGKVHRLGLSGRAVVSRMKPGRAAQQKRPQPRQVEPPSVPQKAPSKSAEFEELVIPISNRKTLDTIEEHHCHWPIGDPGSRDFHFCGKTKIHGSYCEFHARRAFQPGSARPIRNRELA